MPFSTNGKEEQPSQSRFNRVFSSVFLSKEPSSYNPPIRAVSSSSVNQTKKDPNSDKNSNRIFSRVKNAISPNKTYLLNEINIFPQTEEDMSAFVGAIIGSITSDKTLDSTLAKVKRLIQKNEDLIRVIPYLHTNDIAKEKILLALIKEYDVEQLHNLYQQLNRSDNKTYLEEKLDFYLNKTSELIDQKLEEINHYLDEIKAFPEPGNDVNIFLSAIKNYLTYNKNVSEQIIEKIKTILKKNPEGLNYPICRLGIYPKVKSKIFYPLIKELSFEQSKQLLKKLEGSWLESTETANEQKLSPETILSYIHEILLNHKNNAKELEKVTIDAKVLFALLDKYPHEELLVYFNDSSYLAACQQILETPNIEHHKNAAFIARFKDFHLTQLSLITTSFKLFPKNHDNDPFYPEDTELTKAVKEFLWLGKNFQDDFINKLNELEKDQFDKLYNILNIYIERTTNHFNTFEGLTPENINMIIAIYDLLLKVNHHEKTNTLISLFNNLSGFNYTNKDGMEVHPFKRVEIQNIVIPPLPILVDESRINSLNIKIEESLKKYENVLEQLNRQLEEGIEQANSLVELRQLNASYGEDYIAKKTDALVLIIQNEQIAIENLLSTLEQDFNAALKESNLRQMPQDFYEVLTKIIQLYEEHQQQYAVLLKQFKLNNPVDNLVGLTKDSVTRKINEIIAIFSRESTSQGASLKAKMTALLNLRKLQLKYRALVEDQKITQNKAPNPEDDDQSEELVLGQSFKGYDEIISAPNLLRNPNDNNHSLRKKIKRNIQALIASKKEAVNEKITIQDKIIKKIRVYEASYNDIPRITNTTYNGDKAQELINTINTYIDLEPKDLANKEHDRDEIIKIKAKLESLKNKKALLEQISNQNILISNEEKQHIRSYISKTQDNPFSQLIKETIDIYPIQRQYRLDEPLELVSFEKLNNILKALDPKVTSILKKIVKLEHREALYKEVEQDQKFLLEKLEQKNKLKQQRLTAIQNCIFEAGTIRNNLERNLEVSQNKLQRLIENSQAAIDKLKQQLPKSEPKTKGEKTKLLFKNNGTSPDNSDEIMNELLVTLENEHRNYLQKNAELEQAKKTLTVIDKDINQMTIEMSTVKEVKIYDSKSKNNFTATDLKKLNTTINQDPEKVLLEQCNSAYKRIRLLNPENLKVLDFINEHYSKINSRLENISISNQNVAPPPPERSSDGIGRKIFKIVIAAITAVTGAISGGLIGGALAGPIGFLAGVAAGGLGGAGTGVTIGACCCKGRKKEAPKAEAMAEPIPSAAKELTSWKETLQKNLNKLPWNQSHAQGRTQIKSQASSFQLNKFQDEIQEIEWVNNKAPTSETMPGAFSAINNSVVPGYTQGSDSPSPRRKTPPPLAQPPKLIRAPS